MREDLEGRHPPQVGTRARYAGLSFYGRPAPDMCCRMSTRTQHLWPEGIVSRALSQGNRPYRWRWKRSKGEGTSGVRAKDGTGWIRLHFLEGLTPLGSSSEALHGRPVTHALHGLEVGVLCGDSPRLHLPGLLTGRQLVLTSMRQLRTV